MVRILGTAAQVADRLEQLQEATGADELPRRRDQPFSETEPRFEPTVNPRALRVAEKVIREVAVSVRRRRVVSLNQA